MGPYPPEAPFVAESGHLGRSSGVAAADVTAGGGGDDEERAAMEVEEEVRVCVSM